MRNKPSKIVTTFIIVAVLIVAGVVWYVKIQAPRNVAVKEYKTVVSLIEEKNDELDASVKKLQELVDSGEQPLDENTSSVAKEIIKTAGESKVLVEEMPSKTEDIIKKTEELSVPIDYSQTISELDDAYAALDTSIKQLKQFTNPSEESVVQRLQTIDEITEVRAATEDNDPNGQLHKDGGYNAAVFFASSNIDQSQVYGDDLIGKGTDAGGSVEVYSNPEDASKRNEYLSAFDGGILSSGSHKVVGTVVIRTSNSLTAGQQTALEQKVIDAMSKLK